jgi:hypothetical protein
MSNIHPLPTERFSDRMEDLRASLAAEAPQRGLAGEMQRVILAIFEILLRMIAKWREGRWRWRRMRRAPNAPGIPRRCMRAAMRTRRAKHARHQPPTQTLPLEALKGGGKHGTRAAG